MGRRQGTVDERVSVAVSAEMRRLRAAQSRLNGFWANTELCYAYVLSQRDTVFADEGRRSAEALGHLTSEVWYPSNQGRIKRDESVRDFLGQVSSNTVFIYRATILAFYSAFEIFLEHRVGSAHRKGGKWAPLVVSLGALYDAPTPLRLTTVMCADLSRKVRNMVAHGGRALPADADSAIVKAWRKELRDNAERAGHSASDAARAASYAVDQVVGQAVAHVADAQANGKALPIELFYMLFVFTNLDSLAFEIEEAMIPAGARPDDRIRRKAAAVRRRDLIVEPKTAPRLAAI